MASVKSISVIPFDKVCAFVDAQGFGLSTHKDAPFHFKPRELTFYGENGSISYEFSTPIDVTKLSKENQKTLRFQSRYIHGLSFQVEDGEDFEAQKNFERQIVRLYDLYKSKEKTYLAVKNDYLAFVLKDLGINFIDFGRAHSDVPRLKELDEKYQAYDVCKLHSEKTNGILFQCSFRKAKNYWRWILENKDRDFKSVS